MNFFKRKANWLVSRLRIKRNRINWGRNLKFAFLFLESLTLKLAHLKPITRPHSEIPSINVLEWGQCALGRQKFQVFKKTQLTIIHLSLLEFHNVILHFLLFPFQLGNNSHLVHFSFLQSLKSKGTGRKICQKDLLILPLQEKDLGEEMRVYRFLILKSWPAWLQVPPFAISFYCSGSLAPITKSEIILFVKTSCLLFEKDITTINLILSLVPFCAPVILKFFPLQFVWIAQLVSFPLSMIPANMKKRKTMPEQQSAQRVNLRKIGTVNLHHKNGKWHDRSIKAGKAYHGFV